MTSSRKIIIIDDEASARIILRGFIEKFFSGYEVIGEADTVEKGIEILQNTTPDLVFLDIQLNSGTGFNILEAIGNHDFQVVFVTAYENFAIEAFRFAAMDYLLKPLKINDLRNTLQRFEQRTLSKPDKLKTTAFNENIKLNDLRQGKIVLPSVEGFEVVSLQDIIRLESDRNYTRIFLAGNTEFIVSRTLKEFEDLLAQYDFFRIHHSHIIHLKFIKKYVRGQGGEVVMTDESVVPVSRAKKEEFMALFLK
jgi:two-component system, LytTR family, response regulator